MSVVKWKLEKDLCRCCHSEGVFKNLAEPSFKDGQEEIYCDMLQECLDINLTPVSGPLCAVTFTICEDCILRLREACSFKQQVTQCERRFRDLYSRDTIKLAACYEELAVKEEVPDQEDIDIHISRMDDDDDDDEDGLSLNYDDEDDNELLKIKEEEPKKPRPKRPKAKEKAKSKGPPGRPRKLKAEEPDKSTEDEKKEDFIDSSDYTIIEEGNKKGIKKRYSCKRCSVLLNSYDSIRVHVAAVHLNKAIFKCSLCGESFKHRATLIRHLEKKHAMEEITVGRTKVLQATEKCVCKVCKKEVVSRRMLGAHMSRHKSLSCPECSAMISREHMARHRLEVHGVPLPTCGICGYTNSKKDRIITHQRKVHLKEKNVPCPECDAMFFDTVQLRKHLVRHNPVKKFECKFCKKKFPRLNALRAHEKIHTGDKRKVCLICDERFVQKASLNYHMMKHHPEAM